MTVPRVSPLPYRAPRALQASLLKDVDSKLAVSNFKRIREFMGDREPKKGARCATHVAARPRARHGVFVCFCAGSTSTSLALTIIKTGLEQPQMRDEIYCQLTMQVTRNDDAASCTKGWQLMLLCCVTFPPSKTFETTIVSRLRFLERVVPVAR